MGFLRQGIFSLVFVVVACALHALGQASPENNQTTFRVEGAVLNSVTDQPVPRALVQILSNPPDAMLSGPDGEFSFNNVPAGQYPILAGQYPILVMKPGFISPPGYSGSTGDLTKRTFVIGPKTGKIALKLLPEALIYGQVTGTDGEPVEGVTIEVLASHRSYRQRSLTPFYPSSYGGIVPMMQTDEEGNYRIASLPPGTYYLLIKTGNVARRIRAMRARTVLPSSPEGRDYPALIYYPGVTDFDAAIPIQVSGGQRVLADFSLKKVPVFKIAGVLRATPEWKQINPPMIVDQSDDALFMADEFDSKSGSFLFKAVPAGTYSVRLGGMNQNGQYSALYRKLTVTGPLQGLKLVLGRSLDIPVIVHKQFSHPPMQGHCTTTGADGQTHESDCSDYPPAALELLAADSQRNSGYTGFGPQPDPTDIKLRGVMPGKYWVRARPQFGGYVQSMQCGSIDLLRDPLLVPDDGNIPPIEVTLRDDTSEIKLRVRADSPANSGWAVLVPDAPGRDPVVVDVNASADRNYAVPPGRYKVFAFNSMEGIEPADPESFDRYADKATSITLSANGNVTVSVDVLKTGE